MEKVYSNFKEGLEIYPFIVIIGKYDQLLGPREIFSSFPTKEEEFFINLLRDALHTTNEYVTLNFDNFYSQICKVKIEDSSARGGSQLYAIILLRQNQKPLLPKSYLERIKEIFLKLDKNSILLENRQSFYDFFGRVNDMYLKKEEILPIESLNLDIRNSLTTIQGFCELIIEEKKYNGVVSEQEVLNYAKMMIESCKEIVQALERNFDKN